MKLNEVTSAFFTMFVLSNYVALIIKRSLLLQFIYNSFGMEYSLLTLFYYWYAMGFFLLTFNYFSIYCTEILV